MHRLRRSLTLIIVRCIPHHKSEHVLRLSGEDKPLMFLHDGCFRLGRLNQNTENIYSSQTVTIHLLRFPVAQWLFAVIVILSLQSHCRLLQWVVRHDDVQVLWILIMS
ncbi:uncharacterized protein K489DRAFT_234746 [Dissoconium aciculare CBS 342.82]|uniref:Uncharacterized protein n=1 Tax=Dissoconium aciculare CBS 342.82 TaxID=1314786 RepID=A0A6J3M5P5_9PEZI|nr:uncharacterized protein K489DRAFT_234746 [Dissoconium aciculare CBS 342.82]KAF1822162.1 hypothetical protein K489DRAFT_234746 [Dissoconium aciculare CBS 342.82]